MRCFAVLGVFTLALVGNVFGEISDCGEGWTMLELGHAGAVCVNVSPNWKSYQGARQYCRSQGARLFHPYSKDEQKFLFDKMEVPKFYVGAMKKSDDGLVWSSLLASNQEVTKVEWVNLPSEDEKPVLKANKTDDEKLELTCSAPSSWKGQVKFAFRRNNKLLRREKDGPVMEVEMEEDGTYSCVAIGVGVTISNPVKVVDGAVAEEMSDKEICAVAAPNMLWQRIKCDSKGYLAKAVCTRKYDTPTEKTEEEAEKEGEEAAENNKEEANAEGEKAEEEAGKQEVKADDDEETDALRRTLLKAKLINMLKRELKNLS